MACGVVRSSKNRFVLLQWRYFGLHLFLSCRRIIEARASAIVLTIEFAFGMDLIKCGRLAVFYYLILYIHTECFLCRVYSRLSCNDVLIFACPFYHSNECAILPTQTYVQICVIYFCVLVLVRFTLPRFLHFVNIFIRYNDRTLPLCCFGVFTVMRPCIYTL